MQNHPYPPLTNWLHEFYSTTTNGGITFVGNSLGLSKSTNSQDAGTANAIGAFISTNRLLNVPTYPTNSGTTLDMHLNSSSAILTLPSNSEILYAELFWGGTYQVNGEDYIYMTKNPVEFTIPTSPLTTFTVNLDIFQQVNKTRHVGIYSCQANVTNLIQQGLSGTYTVSNVLGTINASNNSDNCCGWTLAVLYKDATQPSRYINLMGGLVLINPHYINNQILNQFETPSTGNTNVKIALSALGGDATLEGDQVLFGSDPNKPLTPLSGPKNGSNNFFASQINNALGETDTTSTFGNRNQIIDINNNTGTNIIAGRQGYDITTVNASNILKNSENMAVVRYQTSSNTYVPNALGVQIDINAPNFTTSSLSCGSFVAAIDSSVYYESSIINTGTLPAENVILKVKLSSEMEFVAGSAIVNGTPNSNSVVTGISLGTLNVGKKVTVVFNTLAIGTPKSNRYETFYTLTYTFLSSTGKIDGNFMSNIVYLDTPNYIPKAKIKLTCNKDIVTVGDTIEYSISITNTAPYNAINCKLNIVGNKLPKGLSYNSGSLTLNGSYTSGSIETGLSLQTLVPNNLIEIKFTSNVTSNAANIYEYPVQTELIYDMNLPGGDGIPPAYETIEDYSNKLTIISKDYIIEPTISISSNKTNSVVTPNKDTIEYSITVSNPHEITISGVKLIDVLPSGLVYMPNSLTIDGNSSKYIPEAGIPIGNIPKSNSVTVKFKANVSSMPSTGLIYPNFSTIAYHLNSPIGVLPNTIKSNTINSFAPINLTTTLTSNQTIIVPDKDATIEYTIKIINSTSANVTSVILTDILPIDLQYKPNSITINGTAPATSLSNNCLKKSVPLGNINAGETTIVKFSTIALTEPPSDNFSNFATIKYNFSLLGNNFSYKVNTNINNVICRTNNIIQLNPLSIKDCIYTTYKNIPIKENICACDINKTPINSVISSYPTNGYVKVDTDNTWLYTPKVNFVGKDSFSLLLTNENDGKLIKTITIIVKDSFEFSSSLYLCEDYF